ncbi:MAG TPA: hypothetical protein VMM58_01915 [Bacteroidota bacterium]|nr:hypothetical protein [Bacteroidota bacterium]
MLVLPVIRRHYLFASAGIFWTIAGGILCIRGTVWLREFSFGIQAMLVGASIAIAGTAYRFGFSKIVKRNIDRITAMPARAQFFAFTPVRGYFMIALMVTIGITLRNSSIPKSYLIVPYYAMGGVLLVGSAQFYRHFIAMLRRSKSEIEPG